MARRRFRAPARSGSTKILMLGGGLLVVALAAVLAIAPVLKTGPAPPGGHRIVVSMAGFAPNRITVPAGQPVTLSLHNPDSRFHTDGGGWHQFAIDALRLDVRIAPSSTETVTIPALAAGTYEFYCDICCGGRSNPSMIGVLVVKG